MNAVIVTGATSMLGIATIEEYIRNGVKVMALSREDSWRRNFLPKSELIKFIGCGLDELKNINLPKDNYDVLYHFGWAYTDRITRDDPILQSKNIEYTLDAVQLAHKYGCKKFLGAGSQAEYGFQNERITEETPVKPDVCYGYAKYAAGRLAEKLCDKLGLICIWTRTFSVYGKYDGENTMVSYALRQYRNNQIAQFSSGLQMWDYLFEEEAGRYFYLLGEKVNENVLVNVASGDTRPLRDYIIEMACVLNRGDAAVSFQYEFEPAKTDRPLHGIHPDVRRLREITGYVPQVSFGEGIRKILDFEREK